MTDKTPNRESDHRQPIQLLLVEDNAGDAELIRLSTQGLVDPRIEFRHASDLRTGLFEIQTSPPEVLLLDLSLPECRGIETLQQVLETGVDCAIIVLTGLEDERTAREALRAGAQDYLIKGQTAAPELERAIRYSLERRRAAVAVREREVLYRTIVNTAREGILTVDPEGVVHFVNPRMAEILEVPVEELADRPLADRVHEADRPRLSEMVHGLSSGYEEARELRVIRGDGEAIWVHFSAAPLDITSESYEGALVMVTDINSRKRFEVEIEHLALHDSLTGLPNRTLLESRVSHALKRRSRMSYPVSVVVIALDRFRTINETLGHSVGDILLTMASQRLLDRMRNEDTVARLGGDEFGVLLETVPDGEAAMAVATRLATAFDEPFEIMGQPVRVSASLGVSVGSAEQDGPGTLLRYAEIAMYRAKDARGVSIELFDPRSDFSATRRLKLETELRGAIENGDLCLHYQPLVHLETGEVLGAEALVRWAHPTRGFMFPSEFIALAEETGLIREMGHWVIVEACRHAAEWRAARDDFVISVNISPEQLLDAELPAQIQEALASTGLDAAGLQLEITESAAVKTIGTLLPFHDLGVRLAIDDVGRGFSSLEYLVRLDVDLLKIDRSFVGGLGTNSRDTAVVEAIQLLASRIGLSVIAEGIETADQLRRLQLLECRMGQGFLFSKPVAPDAFTRLLGQGSFDLPEEEPRDLMAV